MTTEYVLELVKMEGMLRFLEQNYSVKGTDVKNTIKSAEQQKGPNTDATSYLVNKTEYIAKKFGIVYDPDLALNHLPTMLAAIEVMESEIPQEKKQLSLKRKLELLFSGELSSGHNLANVHHSYNEAGKHAERALKLLNFIKDLV